MQGTFCCCSRNEISTIYLCIFFRNRSSWTRNSSKDLVGVKEGPKKKNILQLTFYKSLTNWWELQWLWRAGMQKTQSQIIFATSDSRSHLLSSSVFDLRSSYQVWSFLEMYKRIPGFYHPKGENIVREHLRTVSLLCSKWPTWCFQKYVWTHLHLWFFFCSVIKLYATITLLEAGIWDDPHLCPCELLKFNTNNSTLPLNSSWENFLLDSNFKIYTRYGIGVVNITIFSFKTINYSFIC